MPPAELEASSPGEVSGAHLLEQHGTEMMRPGTPEKPSPEALAQAAIAKLSLGESVVVHLPEGNTKVTYRGTDATGMPIHEKTLLSRPTQSAGQQSAQTSGPFRTQPSGRPLAQPQPQGANPFAPGRSVPPPSPAFGPQGGVAFGPQGTPYEAPERPIAPVVRGNQPPEAHPDAGPDAVRTSLTAEDAVFAYPLKSRRPQPEAVVATPLQGEQLVVNEPAPPIENIKPEAVQTEEDLVEQLQKGTAPPIAEMRPEDRDDMTAVRQLGASAAAKRAQETTIPEDDETPDIPGIGGGPLPEDNQEADITQILPEGVVPEGQRPPGTDYMPGGGPSNLYRR